MKWDPKHLLGSLKRADLFPKDVPVREWLGNHKETLGGGLCMAFFLVLGINAVAGGQSPLEGGDRVLSTDVPVAEGSFELDGDVDHFREYQANLDHTVREGERRHREVVNRTEEKLLERIAGLEEKLAEAHAGAPVTVAQVDEASEAVVSGSEAGEEAKQADVEKDREEAKREDVDRARALFQRAWSDANTQRLVAKGEIPAPTPAVVPAAAPAPGGRGSRGAPPAPPVPRVQPASVDPSLFAPIQLLSEIEDSAGIETLGGETVLSPSADEVEEDWVYHLPAGSFGIGMLLTGADAPTAGTRADGKPVQIVVKDQFNGPNQSTIPIQECFFLGVAKGDFGTARADIAVTTLSCVLDGQALQVDVAGYVVDYDALGGVQGERQDYLAEKVGWAAGAGALEGAGSAFAAANTTQVVSGSGSVTSFVDGSDVGRLAAAGAAAGAGKLLTRYAIERMEALAPSIRFQGGRPVWIVMLDGVDLPGLENGFEGGVRTARKATR